MTNFSAFLPAMICLALPSRQANTHISGATSMDEAQADFALNLLRVATSSNESAILSPFSIAVALSMTSVGAQGETKQQLAEVIAKGQDGGKLEEYFSSLVACVVNQAKGYTLHTANRLYVQQNFTLKQAYLDIIQSDYTGQLQQVDFKSRDNVAKEINSWVQQQTHDKIKDLVRADSVDEDTRLMLVNAVYFKGIWEKQFEKRMTKRKPFYSTADEKKEVNMMTVKAHFPYYEDADVQLLGLPYAGEQVQMFIIFPQQQFGLADVEKKLTGKQLLAYFNLCRDTEVQVQIPKFRMEKKIQLGEALQKLGVVDAFSSTANFSGISESPLYISNVIHKAFIEVNEEGTEAAAATEIGMRLRSAPIMQAPPKRFCADHPYLFAITWQHSTLLFHGRVA